MDTVTRRRIELAIVSAWALVRLKELIPKDTGSLRENSFKYRRTGANSWQIYIDHSIAPYDIYVNEKWVSSKWNGKSNPNEGFWKDVVDFIVNYLADRLGGEVKENK